jgi:transposase
MEFATPACQEAPGGIGERQEFHRHRPSRGGHRQANAALYRIVIVGIRWHQATIEYATRRSAEGRSKRDIIRCLKRFDAREIYRGLLTDHAMRTAERPAATTLHMAA